MKFTQNEFNRIKNRISSLEIKKVYKPDKRIYCEIINRSSEKSLYFEYFTEQYHGTMEIIKKETEPSFSVWKNESWTEYSRKIQKEINYILDELDKEQNQ